MQVRSLYSILKYVFLQVKSELYQAYLIQVRFLLRFTRRFEFYSVIWVLSLRNKTVLKIFIL